MFRNLFSLASKYVISLKNFDISTLASTKAVTVSAGTLTVIGAIFNSSSVKTGIESVFEIPTLSGKIAFTVDKIC